MPLTEAATCSVAAIVVLIVLVVVIVEHRMNLCQSARLHFDVSGLLFRILERRLITSLIVRIMAVVVAYPLIVIVVTITITANRWCYREAIVVVELRIGHSIFQRVL